MRCGLTQNNPDILALSLSSLLRTTTENEKKTERQKGKEQKMEATTPLQPPTLSLCTQNCAVRNGAAAFITIGVGVRGSYIHSTNVINKIADSE